MKAQLHLAAARERKHQGTPYLSPERRAEIAAVNRTLAVFDTHNASRKAPDASVVSLSRTRVQTGRPA